MNKITDHVARALARLPQKLQSGTANAYVKPGLVNVGPNAGFGYTTSDGLIFNFIDQSSDTDGTIVRWFWNISGGEAYYTTKNCTFDFGALGAGTYTVTLTVADDKGATSTTSRSINALGVGNISPVANFTFVLNANRTVQFTNTSSDPDGTIASSAWTFGDASGSAATSPSRAYAAGGSYSVQLTVTDNLGATNFITKTVNVWAKDATSGIGLPATAADWTGVMAQAGLATGNPSNLWTMQEASGNILDKIAAIDLSAPGVSYATAVTGWTQKALSYIETGAGTISSSAAGDLSTSKILLCYYRARTTPSATRTIMGIGPGADHTYLEHTNTPVMQAMDNAGGPATTGASNTGTTVRPYLIQVDVSSSVFRAYSDQERLTGPWHAKSGGNLLGYGALIGTTSNADYLYGCMFSGTAAQLTTAQVKTLLQTLGWTIPWS